MSAVDIKNQRLKELAELQKKGLASERRTKLKDDASTLTTPEQAEMFLAAMRDKSKKDGIEHKPPTILSADGVDAWYMMQRHRERENRERRKEAENNLRRYRASYDPYTDMEFRKQRGRASFGGSVSESLTDPSSPSFVNKRRTSSGGRLQHQPLGFDEFTKQRKEHSFGTPIREHETSLPGGYLHTTPGFDDRNYREEKKTDDPTPFRSPDMMHRKDLTPKPSMEEPPTVWRDFISTEPGAKFAPEKERYHLYASYACPGSHRALIVRALKGLEDVISVTIVHPTWRHTDLDNPDDKHRGWVFGDPDGHPFQNTMGRGGPFPPAYPGNEPDPILGAYSVREIYEYANDTSGKYTIPLLWDKKLMTIVNNESSDISYMLNSCFNQFSSNPNLDLYTEDDEDGLDKLNEVSEWLYPMMIHGVYRCGFAKTQKAYDQAIEELTEAFDMADELLQKQRYLTGDTLTDADIRLFVTLLRFDEVYAFYFRANTRLVMMTPSLLNFCREIYQMRGVAETCQMEQIKAHFFGSHAEWNKYSVIPRGLGFMQLLEIEHDRDLVNGGEA